MASDVKFNKMLMFFNLLYGEPMYSVLEYNQIGNWSKIRIRNGWYKYGIFQQNI